AKAGSDWQKMALRAFAELAESTEAQDRLLGLLEGKIKFKGLVIDVDRRWDMIIKLEALGDKRVEPILAAQRESDKSNRGLEKGYAAEASQPSMDIKSMWWNRIVDKYEYSFEHKVDGLKTLLRRKR